MHNIHPLPKYQLIGHRGTGGLRPENTLCSFSHAAELGLNWIEFDVQLTKDEHWVVMHDETIDRTTNGHGRIEEFTLEALKKFQAGLWHKPPYPSQSIPTLTETLVLAKQLGLHANIEIKGSEITPTKHASLMAKFLHRHFAPNSPPPLLSSFDLDCLVALRAAMPDQPIAYLIDSFDSETINIAKTHNFTSINCDVNTITVSQIRSAANNNIPVLLYTVNDLNTAHTWLQQGIAAIFTDRPDLLLPLN